MRRAIPAFAAIAFMLAVWGVALAQPDCTTAACVFVPLIANPATPTALPTFVAATPTRNPEQCAAEYPTVCIPPPPPHLDCADIPYRNFTVLPPDRHHFDGNNDGVGCEE